MYYWLYACIVWREPWPLSEVAPSGGSPGQLADRVDLYAVVGLSTAWRPLEDAGYSVGAEPNSETAGHPP